METHPGAGIGLRRRSRPFLLSGIALLILVLSIWPLQAAIELNYFRATSTENAVLLEWSTAREFNLAGFEILCKEEGEPDSEYHAIGSRIAQGAPDRGAVYNFNVTSGLVYGRRYCFRIREVTTDGTPGEAFDVCGYGPGVTPESAEIGQADVTPTPTTIVVGGEDVTPATPTPTFPGQSPLITPTATPISNSPMSDAEATAQAAALAQFTPTPTFTPTSTPTFVPGPPTETPTWTPTPVSESPVAVLPVPAMAESPVERGAVGEPTPTPLYVVVTATPTPAALAVAPAFTPWPTATPLPVQGLNGLLALNTQNLMLLLLCLTFLSASGLGTLGLVTVIIYLRSREQRDRYFDRYLDRYWGGRRR
ncbi:hypothetical protein FKZ61_004890 [Litorilinea aerophila]|nr:hypothetical protein [Litorilinea aerophila]MCC9075447.1 hypothetical protein [Litorilinea aerophila]